MTATRRALNLSLSMAFALAACLAAFTHAVRAQTPTSSETRVFHLTVADEKGSPIPNLKREDLTAFDGGERREIVSFGSPDVPASVLFLVDASSSAFGMNMGKRRWRGMASLAKSIEAFMDGSNASNEYFVVAFNDRPQLILDGSKDKQAVLDALARLASYDMEGLTALHDALYVSMNKLALRPARKRVLVVFSDGLDSSSNYTLVELTRALKESDVIVYPVGVFTNDHPPDSYISRSLFGELASASGGAAFYPDSGEKLKEVMTRIASELRSQYEVSVSTTPKAKGDGWHEVKFKLAEMRDGRGRKVKATLRARKGFYEAGAPRKR